MSVITCFSSMLFKSRLAQQLTQLQAAERCDISLRHYQNLELGTTNPKLTSAVRIASKMNFSLDSLKEEEERDVVPIQKL